MEDLRRIGDLVGGNIEHIKAIGRILSLYKLGQWRSTIDFLTQQKLNTPRQIASVRNILKEYEECEDDAALKKKYLQLRVQRAAENKRSLRVEERCKLLEGQREQLLETIAMRTERVQRLGTKKENKVKNAVFLSCIVSKVASVGQMMTSLSANCKKLLHGDPLIIEPSGTTRSSSLEAEVRSLVKDSMEIEGEYELSSLPNRHTRDILAEIDFQLSCLLGKIEQLSSSSALSNQLISGLAQLNHVQKVALELAKAIFILRDKNGDREAAINRIELLRRPITSPDTDRIEPDVTKLAGLVTNNTKKSEEVTDVIKMTVSLTEGLLHISADTEQSLSQLRGLVEEAQDKLSDVSPLMNEVKTTHIAQTANDSSMLDVTIRHSLAATELPHTEISLEKIKSHDDLLVKAMQDTSNKLLENQNLVAERVTKFIEECGSLENLQTKELQNLIQSIKQR